MRLRSLETLREERRRARERAEQRFVAGLAGVRAAEEQVARCVARAAAHTAGRLAVARRRLAILETPTRPGLDFPVCRTQVHESHERLLRAQEVLLGFGRQRADLHLATSVARVAEAQALLTEAECRLEVVERFLATRADAERIRRRRKEEREQDDDYSSSRNSSL